MCPGCCSTAQLCGLSLINNRRGWQERRRGRAWLTCQTEQTRLSACTELSTGDSSATSEVGGERPDLRSYTNTGHHLHQLHHTCNTYNNTISCTYNNTISCTCNITLSFIHPLLYEGHYYILCKKKFLGKDDLFWCRRCCR